MKHIIQYFVRYPAMVNLGLILVLLVGIIAFSQVRFTFSPTERPDEIYIDIIYRGASPQEIEEQVLVRIEDNLRDISGMDRFTSEARENSGRITVEMFDDADLNQGLTDVENAVNQISDFPEEMDNPIIHKEEILDQAISVALTGDLPLQEKKDHAKQIRDDFMLRGDISNVDIYGYGDEEIVVELNETQLDRYNITYQEVSEAIAKNNIDMTGGELLMDDTVWQIRARGRENTALEISQIPVRSGSSGKRVLLEDLAEVHESFEEIPAERYLNGERSVAIEVSTTGDEDIVATADYVKVYTDEFNRNHSEIHLEIVEDHSSFIREQNRSLWQNGVMGLLLVLLIMSLFMDKRIAFWVALTIPLSLLGPFILAMFGYDLSINVVSIFGFILVLGMLVDTGVVVTENVYRHYSEFGKRPVIAARDGAMGVVAPMTISLLTTATAISIFFFLPGKPGEFFSEVSFIVIGALLTSLVVTFFFLPAKMTRSRVLSKDNRTTRFERFFARSLIAFRDQWFMPFTEYASYRLKWVNIGIFAILLLGSFLIIRTGIMPVSFFPYMDDNIQLIDVEMEPGTPADTTQSRLVMLENAVYRVNEKLADEQELGHEVVSNVERIPGPEDHQGRLKVVMISSEIRGIAAHEANTLFREEAGEIPGARYVRFLGAGREERFGGLPVDVSLSGDNMQELQSAAFNLYETLRAREDLVDVAHTDKSGSPELHIELNRAGEQLGLTLEDIISQVRSAFFGLEVQNLQRDDDDVRVWLRYSQPLRSSFDRLERMLIRTPEGLYPLHEVADIYPTDAQLEIFRINGRRSIRVDGDLIDVSMSAPAILQDIEENDLPPMLAEYPDIDYALEGQNREARQVTDAMIAVTPVIILLMLALVVINFQSFAQTFLVFLTLPFAFIGVVLGHLIHRETMNIFSLIGMIALVGILINNMLVLITAFNDNLQSGYSFNAALQDAVQSRFRPILLTTLSTVGGLIPMIFFGGLGSAHLKPPAIAIAYGLIFGLFISMTLAPAFLVAYNDAKLKLVRLLYGPDHSPESIEASVQLREHQKQLENHE